MIVGQCNHLVTVFNKSAQPGFVGHLYFPAPQPPSTPPRQPRCDFVDRFDCERRCARRARASPTWICPGLPLRARGIARRWNREGFGATANPAKSRSAEPRPRHIFADVGEQALPQGEWKRHRATHGFVPVAPMCRGAYICFGLRRCRCDTNDFGSRIVSRFEIWVAYRYCTSAPEMINSGEC